MCVYVSLLKTIISTAAVARIIKCKWRTVNNDIPRGPATGRPEHRNVIVAPSVNGPDRFISGPPLFFFLFIIIGFFSLFASKQRTDHLESFLRVRCMHRRRQVFDASTGLAVSPGDTRIVIVRVHTDEIQRASSTIFPKWEIRRETRRFILPLDTVISKYCIDNKYWNKYCQRTR